MTTSTRLPRETWERVNAADAERVAELLGLEPSREHHKYRCPKHEGTSLHAYQGGRGWYCWGGCGAFSHVDLAAATWGCTPAESCERLARDLGIPLSGGSNAPSGRNRAPRMPQAGLSRPRTRQHPDRVRVPQDELLALWSSTSRPVDEDEQVAAFLRKRALDVERIARWNLARALPAGLPPRPWMFGPSGPWAHTGHRLLVPMFDAAGDLRGLQARAVVDVEARVKALSPAGASNAGLVFADAVGVSMLTGRTLHGWGRLVVIVEGIPDFLAWAMRQENPEPADAWAVLGVIAGSWTADLAARIPDGADVTVRTHTDDAGDKYAAPILRDLGGRCTVRRLIGRGE